MRSYVIDELSPLTVHHFAERLRHMECASGIEKLFWLPVPSEFLEPIQREHEATCGPYRLAVELMNESVRLELLVRAEGKIRCECIRYLVPEAERAMMGQLDALISEIQEDELSMLFGVCC